MEKATLNDLKVKLEQKKVDIIKKLEGIGHKERGSETNFTADFPEYGTAAEDNATEVADYTTNLSLEKELEENLRSIEAALKHMGEGTYGICANCGKEIDIERLKVNPESSVCVSCNK